MTQFPLNPARVQGDRLVSGADEIAAVLKQVPPASAQHLQNVMAKNAREHRLEVIRSSKFKTITPASLSHLVTAFPKRTIQRTSVSQAKAGTESYWKGIDARNPGEGAAARLEKSIGVLVNKPLTARWLLIPQGDALTPTGKPKRVRVGGKPVPILQARTLKGTQVIRSSTGQLLIVQEQRGNKAKGLGRRSRVLGILRPSARQERPLDFFGSWERGRAARDARYGRMLQQIVDGRKPAADGA